MYQDELYQQINGVTMLESPLGPTLADFFMDNNLETKLLNKLQTSKPKLIYDNVDDILAIFILKTNEHARHFFGSSMPSIRIPNLL